jgi:Ca2+-binding EF-hand superfamily protein
MTSRILKSTLLSITFFAFTAAHAQEKQNIDKEDLFKIMDNNKDGVISSQEFEPKEARKKLIKTRMEEKLEERFKKLDTDGSGSVSFQEYKAMADQRKREAHKKREMHKKPRK